MAVFQFWATYCWLFLIALVSYTAVFQRKFDGGAGFHFISFVSALPTFRWQPYASWSLGRYCPCSLEYQCYWSWIIPTVIGTPLIVLVAGRYSPNKSIKPNEAPDTETW